MHIAVDAMGDDETATSTGGSSKNLLEDDENKSIIESLKAKMDDHTKVRSTDERPTIYRVPDILRKVNTNAYEPMVISLGPYHHGNPNLKSMDEIKWQSLRRFLSRHPSVGLDEYVCQVKKLEIRMRNAYSEAFPHEAKEFIEMMLLDACLVLECLFDVEPSPAIGNRWEIHLVYRDMLQLENQIPFFLLKELLQLNRPDKIPFLTKTIYDVFLDLMPGKIRIPSTDPDEYHHILHLLVSCAAPESAKANQPHSVQIELSEHLEPMLERIACARSLHESGVVFRKKENKDYQSFLDITFEGGTMEIPPLQILRDAEPVFRNLIAFEQCFCAANQWKDDALVTSYASLMNSLIDTSKDVEMLKGVIVSTLGDDKEIARLFNSLSVSTVVADDNYLSSVYKSINKHCEKGWNKRMATLRHNYFSNPWAKISFIAAIVLFVLTIMQTILAFLDYA